MVLICYGLGNFVVLSYQSIITSESYLTPIWAYTTNCMAWNMNTNVKKICTQILILASPQSPVCYKGVYLTAFPEGPGLAILSIHSHIWRCTLVLPPVINLWWWSPILWCSTKFKELMIPWEHPGGSRKIVAEIWGHSSLSACGEADTAFCRARMLLWLLFSPHCPGWTQALGLSSLTSSTCSCLSDCPVPMCMGWENTYTSSTSTTWAGTPGPSSPGMPFPQKWGSAYPDPCS